MKNLTILDTKELVSKYENGNAVSHKCLLSWNITSKSGVVYPMSKIAYWNYPTLIAIGEEFDLELFPHSVEDKQSEDGKTFTKIKMCLS